jgi:glycosyltransferase involved in cell wall biosynthesis
MRAVLVYNDYPGVSGESVFFGNMARAMGEHGFDICPISQPEVSTPSGLMSHYLRYPLLDDVRKAIQPYKNHDIIHFLNSPLAAAGLSIRGPRMMASAHFFLPSYLSMTRDPNPLLGAGGMMYSAFTGMLDRKAFSGLDSMVACSPFLESELRRSYGLDRTKVIYPGIDAGHFKGAKRIDLAGRFSCEEAIVCLGRLNERAKGFADLIKALGLMERKGAKLIIVGDGPDRGNYERQCRKLGVYDKVVFTGALNFEEKTSIQKSADVVVIPSRYEVYGTVFAESIACGVPVVAYDLPFWKGMYEGSGLFVPPSGPRALADGIGRALDDKGLRKRLISRGLVLTESHDFRKTVDSYLREYEELASTRVKR